MNVHEHLPLSDAMLAVLKTLPGKSLDVFGAANCIVHLPRGEAEVSPRLYLWVAGLDFTICLDYKANENIASATCIELLIEKETKTQSPSLSSMQAQFTLLDFEIKKIEVWAEKTIINDDIVISENTLYFDSTDGQKLLLYPWISGPSISIFTDKKEISEILKSGNLYMKHIID